MLKIKIYKIIKKIKDYIKKLNFYYIFIFAFLIVIIFVGTYLFYLKTTNENNNNVKNNNFIAIDKDLLKNFEILLKFQNEKINLFNLNQDLYINNFYLERYIESSNFYKKNIVVEGEKAYNLVDRNNSKSYIVVKNGIIKIFRDKDLEFILYGDLLKLDSLNQINNLTLKGNSFIFIFSNNIVLNSDIIDIDLKNNKIKSYNNCIVNDINITFKKNINKNNKFNKDDKYFNQFSFNDKLKKEVLDKINEKNNIRTNNKDINIDESIINVESNFIYIDGNVNFVNFQGNVKGFMTNKDNEIEFAGNYASFKSQNSFQFFIFNNNNLNYNEGDTNLIDNNNLNNEGKIDIEVKEGYLNLKSLKDNILFNNKGKIIYYEIFTIENRTSNENMFKKINIKNNFGNSFFLNKDYYFLGDGNYQEYEIIFEDKINNNFINNSFNDQNNNKYQKNNREENTENKIKKFEYFFKKSNGTFSQDENLIKFEGENGSFSYNRENENYNFVINSGFIIRNTKHSFFFSEGQFLNFHYSNIEELKYKYNFVKAYNYLIEVDDDSKIDFSKNNYINIEQKNVNNKKEKRVLFKYFDSFKENNLIKNYLYFASDKGEVVIDSYIDLINNAKVKDFLNNVEIFGNLMSYDFLKKVASGKDKIFIFEFNKEISIFNFDDNNLISFINYLNIFEQIEINQISKNLNNPYFFSNPFSNKDLLEIIKLYFKGNLSRLIKADEANYQSELRSFELNHNVKIFDLINLIYLSSNYIFYEGIENDIYNVENKMVFLKWENENDYGETKLIQIILKGEKSKIFNLEKYAIITGNPIFINNQNKFIVKSENMEAFFEQNIYLFKNNVIFILEQADIDKKRGVFVKGDFANYDNNNNILNIQGNCEVYIDKNFTKASSVKINLKSRTIEAVLVKETKIFKY